MKHANSLAAKVAAFNRAHAEINRLAPLYRQAIAPFIGQKILTATGDYLAKVRKAFPAHGDGVHVFSPHKGCFAVKVSENYGEFTCTYAEPYFYAFTVSNDGTCNALQGEFAPRCQNHTAEGVLRLRKLAETAREAARQAESALSPFGDHDQ